MKIEIGESLCCSYLRHVQQCWVVQANWKVSENWGKLLSDDDLEALFDSMRELFDPDGSVLKQTRNGAQFLKQGEIDVVGLGQDGSVHAMEVAFHENGLNYNGGADKQVLKKLLRTAFVIQAYHPPEVERHMYFASPKVNPGVQQPLEEMFEMLEAEYPDVEWHLLTNEKFSRDLVAPTLEKAAQVSDTSELFVRAARLLALGEGWTPRRGRGRPRSPGQEAPNPEARGISNEGGYAPRARRIDALGKRGELQPLVRALMRTLLEEHPNVLGESDFANLLSKERCEDNLGLRLGGFPLLRRVSEGRMVSGHARYYAKVYGGQYYVVSQWWLDHHQQNAEALARFVAGLIKRRPGHPAVEALERHRAALAGYAG